MAKSQPASDDDLVSVYIPTRNREQLLERALDSVLAQTFTNTEIIIADDASTDRTPALVADYASRHKNIVSLRNHERSGACRTRNRAIFAARGRYITGLDDDDEFTPDRIEQFIRRFDGRWSFLSTLAITTTPSGETHRMARPTRVVNFDDMLYFNRIGNQIFIETERLKGSGGFNPRYPAWQDYELWTRLIARHGPALRLGIHTQHIHEAHGSERISGSDAASRALDLYLEDFGPSMNADQHAAQRFFYRINYPHLGQVRFRDLLTQLGSPVLRELVGAYLYHEYPESMNRISRVRAWLRRNPGGTHAAQRTITSP